MDRIVKVPLSEEDVSTLDMQAKEEGIPRAYLVRRVIEDYLRRGDKGPLHVPEKDPAQLRTLTQALQESQGQTATLRERVEALEKALMEKTRDLEWTRGEWSALNTALQQAIAKIPQPRPLLEDGRDRPAWWHRLTAWW